MEKLKKLLDLIINKISKIPQDKGVHFIVGTMASLFLSFLGLVLSSTIGIPIFNAEVILSIVVIGAILKEAVWDGVMGKGQPDVMDFFATVIPSLLIYILIISQ